MFKLIAFDELRETRIVGLDPKGMHCADFLASDKCAIKVPPLFYASLAENQAHPQDVGGLSGTQKCSCAKKRQGHGRDGSRDGGSRPISLDNLGQPKVMVGKVGGCSTDMTRAGGSLGDLAKSERSRALLDQLAQDLIERFFAEVIAKRLEGG